MSRQQRDTIPESFKASLRASLKEAIAGKTLRQIRGGEFTCAAPTWELDDQPIPDILDLIIDIEFNPPYHDRLWWELSFSRLNRIEMTALYRAYCEEFSG